MKKLLSFALFILLASTALGQTESKVPHPDHATPEAIIKAVYEVISGDAGVERDWDRFRAMFHKDARLIPTGRDSQTGTFNAGSMTPDGYVELASPGFAKQGFHEREIARKMDRYGNIVHVFSTYEAFRKKDDAKPFMRGINSFQLLFDGKRWWIMTIYWQAETPDNPIPKLYLP